MNGTRQARYSSAEDVAGELLELEGKTALDVGCGQGRFTRILAARAKHVTGIDVNQDSLDLAEEGLHENGARVTWLNARAEDMPFDDSSFDVVAFANSLHHVSPNKMATAIGEAGRVLKSQGMLYVMEPVADGSFFHATRKVNDETEVRRRANAALKDAETSGFRPVAERTFYLRRGFDSFEDFAIEQSRRSEKRRKIIEADPEEIRKSFMKFAQEDGGKLWFDQISQVHLFQKYP